MSEPLKQVRKQPSGDDDIGSLHGPPHTDTLNFNHDSGEGWQKLNILSLG